MIKTPEEYLAEVQEFLPEASLDGSEITISAMSNALRFYTPTVVGPRREITPWWCVYFSKEIANLALKETGLISEGHGLTAIIAFERTKSSAKTRFEIYKTATDEISKVITTSENEPAPIE